MYPALTGLVDNPYEFGGNLSARLRRLRDHAVELAREHALDELGKATAAAKGADLEHAARAKRKYSHILYKLMPGRSGSIRAIQKRSGEFATEADDMAATLRSHWSGVFKSRGVDEQLLQTWLDEDRTSRGPPSAGSGRGAPSHRALQDVLVTKGHIRKAIDAAGRSAPGPDGIPYRAWAQLGKLAVDVVHVAFVELSGEGAEALLQQHVPSFSASLLAERGGRHR